MIHFNVNLCISHCLLIIYIYIYTHTISYAFWPSFGFYFFIVCIWPGCFKSWVYKEKSKISQTTNITHVSGLCHPRIYAKISLNIQLIIYPGKLKKKKNPGNPIPILVVGLTCKRLTRPS